MEISTMSGKSLEKHDFPPLEWWKVIREKVFTIFQASEN